MGCDREPAPRRADAQKRRVGSGPAVALAGAALAIAASCAPASAEGRNSACFGYAAAPPIHLAQSFDPQLERQDAQEPAPDAGVAPLEERQIRVTFVGHATFLIETADGVVVATDFAGRSGPVDTPTVVTMNNAHATHFTVSPDPAIAHVLRGWPDAAGRPAAHDLRLGDLRVRNVTTDQLTGFGRVVDGNSIFVFEVGGLCIAHLGHLHHVSTDAQFAALGFVDVVFAPVDGSVTLSTPELLATLARLRARVVAPMHAFGPASLARFVDAMRGDYAIVVSESPSWVLDRASLPRRRTVLIIPAYDGYSTPIGGP